MKTPQEQVIVDAISEWLQTITPDNGYATDAGQRVYSDEYALPNEPEAPSVLILDEGATALGNGKWTLSITLEGLVMLADDEAPNALRPKARLWLSDVRDALRKKRNELPAGAIELRETARRIPRREDGSRLMNPSITLEIDYSDLYQEH